MQAIKLSHLLIGLAMLVAAGLAVALTPRLKLADQGQTLFASSGISWPPPP